ncbi:MAG: Flp pilus assembly complex ATPase component TadA [Nanoarchaeota archaeon]|nr:Flp pilus assembly complex ATPase component TadA [Nanoarchaeota archaeon]
MKIERLVPDTSIIIEGIVSARIKKKEIEVKEVVIHEAVLAELEHQANEERTIGFLGLDEIKRIKELAEVTFAGTRPKASEIKYASLGEMDALIRLYAYENECTLITSDSVQAKVAESKGINVIYIEPVSSTKKIMLEKFFDTETMSVHLREEVLPYAKKGIPGKWEFTAIGKKKLSQDEIREIAREIIEECKLRKDGFIEIERKGSTIVQLGKHRIVITKPPFSDGWEITAVRPIKRLELEDYKLSDKLMERIGEQADGILVAGSPGMGKSTFAQALAESYASKEKVVKTVEAPRDLILKDNITQYSISHGDAQEIHDILLLSRPDYTIFDEMRNTSDFQLFADMRLAGVGMVGIVHATKAIDAIQRFLGRVEMGVIPQIIDTVVFIKNGMIDKVLSLAMTVKVPTGMTEADLARPVVVVNDFETGKLEYEIYSYGEQTVVMPVSGNKGKKGAYKLAEERIKREFEKFCSDIDVEVVSDNNCVVKLPKEVISRVIGKGGKTIEGIEDKLGIHIDVGEKESVRKKEDGEKREIEYRYKIKSNNVAFFLNDEMHDKDVDIYVNDDYLLTAKSGKNAMIKIKKSNKIGRIICDGLNNGERVKLLV